MRQFDFSRAWLISDLHFGVHSNSLSWLQILADYFDRLLLPKMRDLVEHGDVCVVLGDVFENRQHLNLLVMREARRVFRQISQIMPVHIILGNHDLYRKDSNDVTSVEVLEEIDGVEIWREPEVVRYGPKRVLMMPWRHSDRDIVDCIGRHEADILFCHLDVKGLRYSEFVDVDYGPDIHTFSQFERVYSGHIHFAQRYFNVTMLGNPMETRRSDRGNQKAAVLLDLRDMSETEFVNDISPRHLKLKIEDLLDMSLDELIDAVDGQFVDIHFPSRLVDHFDVEPLLQALEGIPRRLEFVIDPRPLNQIDSLEVEEMLSVDRLIRTHLDSLELEAEVAARALHTINELYNDATN